MQDQAFQITLKAFYYYYVCTNQREIIKDLNYITKNNMYIYIHTVSIRYLSR